MPISNGTLAIHAVQHERAGRVRSHVAAGSTASLQLQESGQRLRHLTRSRPHDSASNRGHRHQEPRKPLGGKKAPPERGADKGEGKSRYAICKEEAAHTPNSSELAACGRLSQHGS